MILKLNYLILVQVIIELSIKSPCLHPVFGPPFTPKTPLSVVSAESHPVYDQAQGSGAVFSLTFWITLNICHVFHFSERNAFPFQKERWHVGWEHFLLTPQITNKTPQHHLTSGSWIFFFFFFFFIMGQY